MSVRDFNKTSYSQKIKCYNIKQAKKVLKSIENHLKKLNYGDFLLYIEVEYNDRDSEL